MSEGDNQNKTRRLINGPPPPPIRQGSAEQQPNIGPAKPIDVVKRIPGFPGQRGLKRPVSQNSGPDKEFSWTVPTKAQEQKLPVLPLPPRPETQSEKLNAPGRVRRAKNTRSLTMITMLLFLLVAIAGLAWLIFSSGAIVPGGSGVATAIRPLPRSFDWSVYFDLRKQGVRENLLSLVPPAAEQTVLARHIMVLLGNGDVEEILITRIPQSDGVFVLARPAEIAQTTLTGQDVIFSEHRDWLIAHDSTPELYNNALKSGVTDSKITWSDQDDDSNILGSFVFSTSAINYARQALLGPIAGEGRQQVLSGNLIKKDSAGALVVDAIGQGGDEQPQLLADQQMLSLVPPDITVAIFGSDLSLDIKEWARANKISDSILAEPEIVQRLGSLSAASYVLFRRGSDYGLVINISAEISDQFREGDPKLERALSLAEVLFTGSTNNNLEFQDGDYHKTPLRFVNLPNGQAIDYTDFGPYFLLATSKDTMFKLMDVVEGRSESLSAATNWNELFTQWGAIPVGNKLILVSGEEDFTEAINSIFGLSAKLGLVAYLRDGQSRISGLIVTDN